MAVENTARVDAPPAPKRIGLISDIHANLHALRSVLEALEADSVERVYCCGDVVGYGPFPNECCQVIRDRHIPTIAGNHDHAALGLTTTEYFNDVARRAVQWTIDALDPDNAAFLKRLPLTIEEDDFLIVHASPVDPAEWSYILTISEARESFEKFAQQICFIGHSHQPFIVRKSGDSITCPTSPMANVDSHSRYLVNVGSVGQPRDQNEMASFAIYDRTLKTIEIKRCAYDIDATRRAIRDQKLPDELGERLTRGW